MKILVTGADGQLGSEVVARLRPTGHALVLPSIAELDLLRPGDIAAVVAEHRPDQIINCAAYTQVDRAESEADAAFTINRDAAGALAASAVATGARLLHVSTDFVFDGAQRVPYLETDTPNPLGVYGRSKLEGEQAVLAALPSAVVLRTAWVFGVHGHNFVKTMIRAALAGRPLRVVDDQFGTPTWAADLAGVIVRLIDTDAGGLFHFTSRGRTSWHGFAVAILEEAARLGFALQTQTVEPIPTSGYPTPARRPASSMLDCGKIVSLLSLDPPDWRDSLKSMLGELKACADCL